MNSYSGYRKLFLLVGFCLPLLVFTQDDIKRQTALSFVNSLNEKQFLLTESLTIDSFVVRTLYGGKDRKKAPYFLALKNKSTLNSFLHIDSSIVKENYVRLYVKSSSDLVKFIGVPELPLTYTFLFEKEKIMELQIDSLRGYNSLMAKNDRRWNSFENWAHIKYPEINITYVKLQYADSLSKLIRIYHSDITQKK